MTEAEQDAETLLGLLRSTTHVVLTLRQIGNITRLDDDRLTEAANYLNRIELAQTVSRPREIGGDEFGAIQVRLTLKGQHMTAHRPVVQTVRIAHDEVPGGVVINLSDFDPDKHVVWAPPVVSGDDEPPTRKQRR